MRSLHTRLDEQKQAVLEEAKAFGRFQAMSRFGVSDYVCFSKWIEEVTGNADYGIHPTLACGNSGSLGDQLVAAFLRKVSVLEAENEKLRQQARMLEWQLDRAEEKGRIQALAILKKCEV